jgi:hypothetical protein
MRMGMNLAPCLLWRLLMESKSTTVMELDSNPANRDPLTKEAGSHPFGTGVGSAGGAAGHAAGEAVNPTVEGAYWSKKYKTRPYYRGGQTYVDYEPGYRYGWESGARPEYLGRKFVEVEGDLEKGWEKANGSTARTWAQTRDVTRDAWDRVHGD